MRIIRLWKSRFSSTPEKNWCSERVYLHVLQWASGPWRKRSARNHEGIIWKKHSYQKGGRRFPAPKGDATVHYTTLKRKVGVRSCTFVHTQETNKMTTATAEMNPIKPLFRNFDWLVLGYIKTITWFSMISTGRKAPGKIYTIHTIWKITILEMYRK